MKVFDAQGNLRTTNAEAVINARLINLQTVGFRLSLTNNVAVTTSDVTGATTIYLVPYGNNSFTNTNGGQIALYYDSTWQIYQSTGVSVGLGTITSGKNYDIFAYYSGSAITLELLAWTDDTNRATNLALLDGVLIKSGDSSRRYLGTMRTTSTTQTEDSVSKRFLWNMYNRRPRPMVLTDTGTSFNYSAASWQQWRATASWQLAYVAGLNEDVVDASAYATTGSTVASAFAVGVGLGSTTVNSAQELGGNVSAANWAVGHCCRYRGLPGIGYRYLVWLQIGFSSGVQTWYTSNAGAYYNTSITATVWG